MGKKDDGKAASTSVSRLLGIYSDLQAISGMKGSDVTEVVSAIVRDRAGIDRLQQIFDEIPVSKVWGFR